jgi:RNA polymerase sigma-70 factor (ECF subfamily)
MALPLASAQLGLDVGGVMTTLSARLFEKEIAPYRGELYRAALRLTHEHCNAEDLVQETLAHAFTSLATFTAGSNARAWLHRILANTSANSWRKRQREPALQQWDFAGQLPVRLERGGCAPSAESEALAQLADGDVMRALAELPACFRAPIYLADVHGYRCREIAGMLGIPIGTVMSRLHRGRAVLRRRLAAFA